MWDQGANGYARGDGVAALVLKTLSAALADGDHIEAIIRETGVNQDGRSRGITMPSATAQTALIRATYARAGLNPDSEADRCQYFEAHGTGTPAGDPVEAEAVHTAFFGNVTEAKKGDSDREQQRLLVGSIKTIIGHTESTAGIAGIMKVVQAMKHGYVPPNMLLEKLNPNVLPFYNHLQIPQELMPWPKLAPGQPRRASVNSFGFGGTNAHIILEGFEEPPPPNDRQASQSSPPRQVTPFLFSAQSKQSLLSSLAAHAEYLSQHPSTNLADLSWSLRSRRSRLPLRLALPASSTTETLQASLKSILNNTNFQLDSKSAGTSTTKKSARLLGIFTGQGAQWARMGAELVETSAYAASLLADMDRALAELPEADRPGWTLREQLLADAKTSQVGSAAVAQPLCTAVQVILVELLRMCGMEFAAVVGHSSGEIGAAFAAGVLQAEDAIRIAYYRGLHSRLAGGGGKGEIKGAMLAVGTSLEDAQGLCEDDYFAGRAKVAACNSASSITISGDEDAIVDMVDIFEDENKFVRRLRVDKAYHSHHMVPCSQPYLDSMAPFTATGASAKTGSASGSAASSCIWVSSVRPDGPLLDERSSVDASYWVDNLLSPVLFKQAVERAIMELGPFDAAIEVGPHPALKGPVLDTLRDHNNKSEEIPYTGLLQRNTDAIESVSAALGYVWTHVDNLDIDFDRYDACMGGPTSHRFIPDLPTYQWNHNQGYWHESNLSRSLRTRSQPVHPLLGDLQPQSSAHQVTWKAILRPQDLPWVHHHRIQGQTVFPAAAYAATALETIPFLANGSPVHMIQIQDLFIHQALVFGNDDQESGIEVRSVVSNIRRGDDSILAHFTYEAITGHDQSFQLVASCEISVAVGEPLRDMLPATARLEPYMVDVDTELAYSSLAGVGYGYTGPFKALSGLKRKLGKASGTLALTHDADPDQTGVLMIHPAVLDAAFHSIILTFSYPEDGRLWSLHLPTRIDRIRVNPSLCGRNWVDATQVPFVASMGDDDADEGTSGFQGDVDIHDPTGEYTAVQVEGLHVVPFTPASAADDQQQFYATDWVPSEPNCDLPGTYEASVQDKEVAAILERGSLFYLSQLEHQIHQDHPGRSDKYNAAYLNFASHTLKLVQQGRHRYAKKEWLNDTLEDIVSLSAPFADQPEIQAMHVVGEQMSRAIRGETNMLEHLMNNGLLADYYAKARSITRGTALLADTVAQITQRYPRAKILEVGAGTGGATREILKRIGDRFSTYAFTDVSAGFFDKAQEEFAAYEGAMTYSVLDLEQEVKAQGFEEHSYDVVVASFVLHATLSLEQTVRRVRSLLKPGGYLVLFEVTNTDIIRGTALFGCLPGWWQGMDEGRTLGACVSESAWDSILRKTGFSGVDTMTPVKDAMALPNSVMVSQALSEWVELVREPLMASASPSLFSSGPSNIIKHLFIVGGSTLRVSRLAEDVRKLIHGFCDDITRVASIEELDNDQVAIGSDATVLVLEDLDHAVFKDITPARWNGLKSLFGSQKAIAWVTQDRMADNPFANMAVGFARSALWEIPEIRYQFIDFQDAYRIDARTLAEAVLRFQMAGSVKDNTLWSVESEIVIDADGRQLVPRMRPVSEANDRYNSSRRAITKDVNPQESPIAYETKGGSGGQYALVQRSSTRIGAIMGPTVTLKLSLSSLRAIKTAAGLDAFLVIGTCIKTGIQYLGLCDSIHVTSLVEMPQNRVIPLTQVSTESASLFLALVAAHLVLPAMTASLRQGDTLVVHNAPASLAHVLSQHAKSSRIKTIYTTSSKAVAAELGWIHIGRYMRQSETRTLLPAQVSRCVDFTTTTGKGVSMVASCLPFGVPIVDGTAWFPVHGRLAETETMLSELLQAAQDSALSTLANNEGGMQPGISQVNIQQLGTSDAEEFDALAIVDWSAPSVAVEIQPAAVQFRADRTYWLVGLSGDLGISIADWMIRNGAKYLVITSRNPNIDERWLRSAETRGAVVSIMSW
jgi:hybrid polyketide synthase/nonribosomal peptide synthetase ACE1